MATALYEGFAGQATEVANKEWIAKLPCMQEVVNNLPGFKLNCVGKPAYEMAGSYRIQTDSKGDSWFTLSSALEVKNGNFVTSGFAIYPNGIDNSQIEAVFNSCVAKNCTPWKIQIDYEEFNKEVKGLGKDK